MSMKLKAFAKLLLFSVYGFLGGLLTACLELEPTKGPATLSSPLGCEDQGFSVFDDALVPARDLFRFGRVMELERLDGRIVDERQQKLLAKFTLLPETGKMTMDCLTPIDGWKDWEVTLPIMEGYANCELDKLRYHRAYNAQLKISYTRQDGVRVTYLKYAETLAPFWKRRQQSTERPKETEGYFGSRYAFYEINETTLLARWEKRESDFLFSLEGSYVYGQTTGTK